MVSPEQLEKAFEDIEDLKKKVNALTEDLLVDTANLKEQIRELTATVQTQVLELNRSVASIRIDGQLDSVVSVLENYQASSTIIQQSKNDAAKCRAEIFHSDKPFSLVNDFVNKWKGYFKEHSYDFTTH